MRPKNQLALLSVATPATSVNTPTATLARPVISQAAAAVATLKPGAPARNVLAAPPQVLATSAKRRLAPQARPAVLRPKTTATAYVTNTKPPVTMAAATPYIAAVCIVR